MKKTNLATALASVTLLLSPQVWANSSLPVALPEFKDQAQMAQWTRVQTPQGAVGQPSATFYIGKPYVADEGGYVYKYRTYNPEMSRWTSVDPSGFPDGANNLAYAPSPTCGFDSTGLFYSGTSYLGATADELAWDTIEVAMSGSDPMAVEAMEHADGTTPGNWTLSNADTSAIKGTQDYLGTSGYYQSVESALGSPTAGPDKTPVNHFLFTHGTDEYDAFGYADLSTSGTVTVSNLGNWTYKATVTLSDVYSFAAYSSISYFTPTGLGYRLQNAGYLHVFSSSGTWTDTWVE